MKEEINFRCSGDEISAVLHVVVQRMGVLLPEKKRAEEVLREYKLLYSFWTRYADAYPIEFKERD